MKLPDELKNVPYGRHCDHKKLPVSFDAHQARDMTPGEVRNKFPRFYGPCPECKEIVIGYASFEHFIMGDW